MNLTYLNATASAIACLMLLALIPSPASAIGLFGTTETRSSDLSSFPKWTEVVSRNRSTAGKQCAEGLCHETSWNEQLAQWAVSGNSLTTIRKANDTVNNSPYVLDMINWGKKDFWASPLQFLIKDGDCEDYAITKYMVLKNAGFPAEDMRIVVLQDENLGIMHAVLTVRYNGRNYILDNQIESVVTDRDIVHYKPVYSINERAWWRHMP